MGKISEFLKDIKSDKFLTVAVIILIISGMTLSWSIYELSDSEEMENFTLNEVSEDGEGLETNKDYYHLGEPVTIKVIINSSIPRPTILLSVHIDSLKNDERVCNIFLSNFEKIKQNNNLVHCLYSWNQKDSYDEQVPG